MDRYQTEQQLIAIADQWLPVNRFSIHVCSHCHQSCRRFQWSQTGGPAFTAEAADRFNSGHKLKSRKDTSPNVSLTPFSPENADLDAEIMIYRSIQHSFSHSLRNTPTLLPKPRKDLCDVDASITDHASRALRWRRIESQHVPRLALGDLQHPPSHNRFVFQTSQHSLSNLLGLNPNILDLIYHSQFLGMISPQRRLDYTRRDTIDSDSESFFQGSEGTDET